MELGIPALPGTKGHAGAGPLTPRREVVTIMTALGETFMTAVQDAAQSAPIRADGDTQTVDRLYEMASKDLLAAQETIRQLTEALQTNRDIGAAIGILMSQFGLTQGQAFDRLRVASQNWNVKLLEVARSVLYTGTLDRLGR
jgi:AmiR/NasT family two-component response regulator